MKHRLQWKFIGIMFISLFVGIFAMAVSQGWYGYTYGLSAEETEEIFETGKYAIVTEFAFVSIVVLVFLILSRKMIKRIEQLNGSIKQISKGNMKDIPKDKHKDEIGTLSASVQEMAEMLEKSLIDERAMICNIAHDLRTPVTSIQGYAQLLEQSEELSLQNREYVTIIQRKSEHLSEQITDLLEYSLLQFEEKEYEFAELSLSSLVEQIFVDFIPQLDALDIHFSLRGNEVPHKMMCNRSLMIRMLENLMNNAIRYGKKGKKIEASLSEDALHIYLEIANYGNTLTKAQIENIFKPFYQGEDAKEYVTQSKGLGLAIVSKIVEIHHGKISVQSDEKSGRIAFLISFEKCK